MKLSSLVPLALAFTLVGGCSVAPGAIDLSNFVNSLPLTEAQKTLASQYVQDLTLALQADADQTSAELISVDSLGSYAIMAGGRTQVNRAPKMKARMEALKTKAKARLEKRKAGMQISQMVETTNEDGSIDRTVTMEKTSGVAIKRVVTRHYVVAAENEELAWVKTIREMTHKNGIVFKSTRLKEINQDDTYKVTYDSAFTRKDGKTKTVHWVRTGNADGVETMIEGTLTRFDGTVINLAAAKASDGTSTVSLTSDGVSVAATQSESTEQVLVTVTDPATSKSETTTVDVPEDGTPVAEPAE